MSTTSTDPLIFYVYILKSAEDNAYYTGLTSRELHERVEEHNAERSSTPSTKLRKRFYLVYYEAHKSLEDAREREKFWKSGYGRELRDRCFSN